jgi:cell division protein FtsI/penicillin-binding protein 2
MRLRRATHPGRRPPTPLARLWRRIESRQADLNPLDASDRPDEAFESGWRGTICQRGIIGLVLVAVWGASLQARLVYLQIVEHDHYRDIAQDQQQDLEPTAAMRGEIRDRHGRLMAFSVDAQSLAVRPGLVKNPKATLEALCAALGDCTRAERAEWLKKFTAKRRFDYLRRARDLSPATLATVVALKLPGITTETDTRRYYPAGDLAAHVLGYVSVDNRGQGGIEYAYDKQLQGQPGRVLVQTDALRNVVSTQVQAAPEPGANIALTIDLDYQHILESELEAGVVANRALAGTAILMNPSTGEVLASATFPSFNSNNAWEAPEELRMDRSTQGVYEPGSTFKIITASAAIEEGVFGPADMIDTNPGYILIPGRSRAVSDTHPYGVMSFEDVIVKSSNVGAIKAALRTGPDRFAKYVQRFGFGEATAPDVIGESRGLWNDKNLTDSALASAAMGYEVSVTPLQMVAAVSAVANGGLLMQPRFVRSLGDAVVTPKVLRRAIEPRTAATMTAIMEGVVERGTATTAQVTGFRVAGKTGTSKKVIDGRYSDTDYNASFVGFFPSRAPQFTLLVVVDTPRAGSYYGGTVAGPIFRKIASAVIRRSGLAPTIDAEPPVVLRAGTSALSTPTSAPVIVPTVVPAGGPALMPDLRGLSLRAASRTLTSTGLAFSAQGQGFVTRQWPEPGRPIDAGDTATIRLERRAPIVNELRP